MENKKDNQPKTKRPWGNMFENNLPPNKEEKEEERYDRPEGLVGALFGDHPSAIDGNPFKRKPTEEEE